MHDIGGNHEQVHLGQRLPETRAPASSERHELCRRVPTNEVTIAAKKALGSKRFRFVPLPRVVADEPRVEEDGGALRNLVALDFRVARGSAPDDRQGECVTNHLADGRLQVR